MSFALAGRINNLEADTDARLDALEASVGSGVSADMMLANFSMGGAWVVSWTGVYLKWTGYIEVMPVQKPEESAQGVFQIEAPTSGSITYYSQSGLTTATATASGIPMGMSDALFYELPPRGSSGNSDQSRFRLVDYRNADWVPNDRWVLIARKTGG
jgi:hypothetical protein